MSGSSLAAAVVARARTQPGHPAIVSGERTVTYAELVAAAHRVAAVVAELPGDGPVAVQGRRQPSTIAAFLGVLLAGRAYVPLNPADPAVRQRTMVEAAGAAVLDAAALDEVFDAAGGPAEPPGAGSGPDDLAYVFFTSGSTGVPKGVPISHGNAMAFVEWADAVFVLGPDDTVGVYAPLYFDLSIFDVFAGLRAGAALVLLGDDEVLLPRAVLDRLAATGVTVLYAVPSALLAVIGAGPATLPALRLLLMAGEAFPAARLDDIRAAAPNAALHNLYGPIEANVVSHFAVPGSWPAGTPVPIGVPASGAELALLADASADGAAAPGDSTLISGPGSGELLISGPSLFAGYLPASVPPPDPFLVAAGRRWYRTSDLAVRDADGVYHFRGRTDRRLKNRGFLVEPAEVEHTLAGHPGLGAAVVVVTEAETSPAMHAYVVPAAGAEPAPTRQDLRTWLAERLPRYLWPAEIHLVDTLPLGRTGKVDRTRLAVAASGGGGEEAGEAETGLDDLVTVVLGCLRKLLVEDAERGPDTPLLGSDGVDSLVLVELVTACEQAGRTTLDPDLFVPATFATARTFATALAAGRRPEGVGP